MHLHNKKEGNLRGPHAGPDDVPNLCRKFPKDLSNPDALRTEIDLMSQDIQHVCPQNDLRAVAKMMCRQWQRYPNLCKAYQ